MLFPLAVGDDKCRLVSSRLSFGDWRGDAEWGARAKGGNGEPRYCEGQRAVAAENGEPGLMLGFEDRHILAVKQRRALNEKLGTATPVLTLWLWLELQGSA